MALVIRIASRRPGFRRAGVAHPAEAIDHPIDRFTPAQLLALFDEPVLAVQLVDGDKILSPEETAAVLAELAAPASPTPESAGSGGRGRRAKPQQ